jgi:hypothetical protein
LRKMREKQLPQENFRIFVMNFGVYIQENYRYFLLFEINKEFYVFFFEMLI